VTGGIARASALIAGSRSPHAQLFFLLGRTPGWAQLRVFMIESQIRYVADAIKSCDKLGAGIGPTRAAQDRFNDELQLS